MVQEFGATIRSRSACAARRGRSEHPGRAEPRQRGDRDRCRPNIPISANDGNDTVSGKVAGEFRQTALDRADRGDGRGRALHLDPVRMAVWRGRAVRAVPRCLLTLGLFALFQLEFSSRSSPRSCDHRLFAQRYDRRLRPHPREPEEIPQDAAACAARPVGQRNAGAHGDDLAHAAGGAVAAAACLARPACSAWSPRSRLGLFVGTYSSVYLGERRSSSGWA